MFKKIEDVRYTNSAHDILYVLFIDDDDNKQEMYIESLGPERDEIASMGIDEDKILDNTANYKLQSKRHLDSIAKAAARDKYENELSSLENYKESLKSEIKSLKILDA